MTRHIAILLTVFNRKDKTLLCLQNLYKQVSKFDYVMDVYLTNDGCTDGTPEAIVARFPQVHVINGKGNLFWNRGMWTAWDCASRKHDYDYYIWLNDDTFLYDNALFHLIRSAEETDSKCIIVGATVDTATKYKVTYGGRIKNKGIPELHDTLTEIDYFNGNIVLVPAAVYHTLGNLDYYFTHSKGDFDYGMRAKKAGIKMYQVGKALGECDEHPTLDRWCNPDVPFIQRWKMLHCPNGMPPKETFHLEKRHYGLAIASFHYCTIYLRCLFPRLWKIKSLNCD